MSLFYQQQPIRFECTGCGRCCLGHPDEHYIELAPGEAKAIRQYLNVDKKAFERQYLVKIPGIGKGISINQQGRCVLLDELGRCSVYSVRPRQCMTYPFWPELMHSAEAWEAEAGRCEGINRGAVVAVSTIEKQMK